MKKAGVASDFAEYKEAMLSRRKSSVEAASKKQPEAVAIPLLKRRGSIEQVMEAHEKVSIEQVMEVYIRR